ncbi:hypothetical protein GTP46_05505 [Duganella sp. FT135W]|uniref:Type IV pilus biogenesis protein PilP n=1 Tax=Duganella flavida TaxID=2692175 RepID=A0A6L8K4D9_9BURK|nr:hypothetical protein [Duganella flavida]MYM22100.1 hypothetical protein [Duganella flavida]
MKALLVLLAVSGSALANDADLLRCRAIPDISSRVACYDAIPVAATPVAPVAAVAAPAPAAVKPVAAPAATFGLNATQMRKADEPNFIESTLIGHIDGWSAGTQFRLANGQIWRVADDSTGSINEVDNPKVKITRNALGTLFLEIEGTTQAPRVRRVQ